MAFLLIFTNFIISFVTFKIISIDSYASKIASLSSLNPYYTLLEVSLRTIKIFIIEENILPVLALINSAESGFFCGIMEEPVLNESGNFKNQMRLLLQIIKSSANLDKCMLNVETINKKSRTKSLSETLSIEFSDGFLTKIFC